MKLLGTPACTAPSSRATRRANSLSQRWVDRGPITTIHIGFHNTAGNATVHIMTNQCSIDLSTYAPLRQASLTIPIVEDPTFPLDPHRFGAMTASGSSFTFRIDEAINAAERHLWVTGRPSNPSPLVEDWLNLLRWEFSTFWTVDTHQNAYSDHTGTRAFSSEHPRRVGELFAEGIAILLLEQRLRLSRSKLFFYRSPNARPDFVFTPSRRLRRALMLDSRRVFGLEVRSRAGWSSIRAADHESLQKKKAGRTFSGVLAVYASHGLPTQVNKEARTKLILGDPADDGEAARDVDVVRMLLIHYLGVLRRLGLWKYVDRLTEYLKSLDSADTLPEFRPFSVSPSDAPITETINDHDYVGRFYSEYLIRVAHGAMSRQELRARVANQDFGTVRFRGVSIKVLESLRTGDWLALERFFDESSLLELADAYVGADGSVTLDVPVTPNSLYAIAIRNDANLRR